MVFVEENTKAVKLILDNAKSLGLTAQVKVLPRKVELVLPFLSKEPPFDFVFIDPPYHQGYEEKILNEWPWEQLLVENARVCIESAYRKEGSYTAPAGLEIVRDERYGDSQLTFYRRTAT